MGRLHAIFVAVALASCHLVSGHADLEPRRGALAQLCGRDADCESGFCVEGVCCEERCNGTCLTCSEVPGECQRRLANTDPEGECPDGVCDGAGQCAEGNLGIVLRLGVGVPQQVDDVAARGDGTAWAVGRYLGDLDGVEPEALGPAATVQPFLAELGSNGEVVEMTSWSAWVEGAFDPPLVVARGDGWAAGLSDRDASERVITDDTGALVRRQGALTALAAGADGSLYATVRSSQEEALVRVDLAAQTEVTLAAPFRVHFGAHALGVDGAGAIVVAGSYEVGGMLFDRSFDDELQGVAVGKLAPSGEPAWVVELEREVPDGMDEPPFEGAVVLTVDAAGDVVVAFEEEEGARVVGLAGLDGTERWSRRFEGALAVRDVDAAGDTAWLVGQLDEPVTLGAVRLEPQGGPTGAWLAFDPLGDVVGHRVMAGEVSTVAAASPTSWRVGGSFRGRLDVPPLTALEAADEDGFVSRWDGGTPSWVQAVREPASEAIIDDVVFDEDGLAFVGRFERSLRIAHPQGELDVDLPPFLDQSCPHPFVARVARDGLPSWVWVAAPCASVAGRVAIASDDEGLLVAATWVEAVDGRWFRGFPTTDTLPVEPTDVGTLFRIGRTSAGVEWQEPMPLRGDGAAGKVAIDAKGDTVVVVGGINPEKESPKTQMRTYFRDVIVDESSLEAGPAPEARWALVGTNGLVVVERIFRGFDTETVFSGFTFSGRLDWQCKRAFRAVDVALLAKDDILVATDVQGVRRVRPFDCRETVIESEPTFEPPTGIGVHGVAHDGVHALLLGPVDEGAISLSGAEVGEGWSLAKLAGLELRPEDLLFERIFEGQLTSPSIVTAASDGRIAVAGSGLGPITLDEEALVELRPGDAWVAVVGP